jgi:hypothetical protein
MQKSQDEGVWRSQSRWIFILRFRLDPDAYESVSYDCRQIKNM